MVEPGQIVVLNGAPRSGKSSIAAAIQETFDGVWMNLGVDVFVRGATPDRYRPGVGLRPGGERPDLEPLVPVLYAAMYDAVVAHSRRGLHVVVDAGHHDGHSVPLRILSSVAAQLTGLPALFVGVRCPLDVIMERRAAGQAGREGGYLVAAADGTVPDAVLRWQSAVHEPGVYDLEVDTSVLSPRSCADAIRDRLARGPRPTAFERIAAMGPR